jgi:hypothetical protein
MSSPSSWRTICANQNAGRHSIAHRALRAGAIIHRFLSGIAMEAERINSIANLLADIAQRETELRRYL